MQVLRSLIGRKNRLLNTGVPDLITIDEINDTEMVKI